MSRLAYSRRQASAGLLAKMRAGCRVDLDAAGPGWRALSQELQREAELITGRLVVNVACAPGAGQGHLGFWMASLSHIGLDGGLLPVAPEDLNHHHPAHHAAFCALRGVFLHEVGHADHTPPHGPRDDRALAEARATLEELRMESRVVDDRPQDARWIRCAALRLIVADAAAHAPASVYAAATMATLTEARVLAGTLELDDIADLTPLLDEAIPADVREPLRLLWADVCAIADGDEDAMTAAAKRFVELVGSEEESAPLVDDELFDELLRALEAAAVETGERAAEGLDCGPMLLHVECNLDRPEGPKLPLREVFYEAVGDSTVEWGHRTPTTSERNARARIAATLRRARHRDRDVTVVEREGPPGRVKMRVAMRADSQRARGQMVTAMPWRAKRRRVVESPKVRLGTAVDTSGSMAAYCEAISSACWTLTGAVTDTEGRAAAVAFGDEARLVVPAGHAAPRSVYEFDAPGAMEMVADALEILDAELRMAEPGPRIAVVVSDGQWVNPHQRDHADSILARWRAQGVHVICVGVGKHPLPHPADHVCFINDADDLAREISLACAEALKTVT